MPRDWSYKTLNVLHAVAKGSRYGFDIMDATGLKSGQVYRALNKFEEAGLVRSEWEDPDAAVQEKRPRRRYQRPGARHRRIRLPCRTTLTESQGT